MDNSAQLSRGHGIHRFWAAAAVGLLLLTLGACGGDATPTPGAVVVESGVAPLTPSAARLGGADDTSDVNSAEAEGVDGSKTADETSAGELEDGAPTATGDGFPTLDVDSEVVARGSLRIYAAAQPNVPTLDEYAAGDRFTILGPPDDVPIYPVELAGVRWYRVRAADGLVGWVIADGIEPIAGEKP